MKISVLPLIIFIASGLLQSCNNKDVECPGDSISQLRIGFTRKVDSTSNQYIVYCPGLSDSIYYGAAEPTQIEIPVDITNDTMAIYIDFINKTDTTYYKETDSIKFEYRVHSYMNDLECGIITEFPITSIRVIYSSNHIDTAFFTDNKIINSEKVNHVEIYY